MLHEDSWLPSCRAVLVSHAHNESSCGRSTALPSRTTSGVCLSTLIVGTWLQEELWSARKLIVAVRRPRTTPTSNLATELRETQPTPRRHNAHITNTVASWGVLTADGDALPHLVLGSARTGPRDTTYGLCPPTIPTHHFTTTYRYPIPHPAERRAPPSPMPLLGLLK